MNRSVTIVVAVGALAVAGAVAVPVAYAGAADSGEGKRVHLTLIETNDAFHAIDVPAAAADGQAGDLITFESTLSQRNRVKVGRLEGSCIQIRADGTLDDCSVTVTIGASSFRIAGPFDPVKGGTLPILGGTGRWVGAAGTDIIVNQPDGTAIHTIDLIRA
jgi:hypothetical protein